MRRFLVTMGVAAIAALAPAVSHGDDQKIAESIIERLQVERDGGKLAGFNINLEVDQGTVWVKGHVSEQRQQTLVLDVARRVPGVKQVVDDIDIACEQPVQPVDFEPAPAVASSPFELPAAVDIPAPRASVAAVSEEIGAGLPESSAIPAIEPIAAAGPIPTSPLDLDGGIQRTQAVSPAGPSDQWIGRTLVAKLGQMEQSGVLAGCGLDLHVEDRSIYLEGTTASEQQRTAILEVARRISGVRQVVNGIRVQNPIRRTQALQAAGPVAIGQATPVAMNQGGYGGAPVPMHNASMGGGAGVSYDNPQLPPYAWPSTAAHPNYAALQYPRQYSPSTWPYIGPFYPYPQVPLGWRKISLEWDDGWWFLDFHTRSH